VSKRKSKKGNPFGAGEKGAGREGLNLAKHGGKKGKSKKSAKREAKREKGRY
jgi:hypothetical protein